MERVNKWMKKLYLITNLKDVERQAMIHVERLAVFSSVLSVPMWQYGRPPTPIVNGIKVGQAKNKMNIPGDPVNAFLTSHFKEQKEQSQSKFQKKKKKKDEAA